MSFYSSWFKQTVNNDSNGPLAIALQADLTPAQVTVCTIRDKLVYNMEYKPISPTKETTVRKPHSEGYRTRESTASSSSSNSSNNFAAANVVAARIQNRTRSHTRRHSRQISTESQAVSIISEDSMWDDWIVKYINEDNKQTVVDDAQMEDWIFETTM